MRRQGEEAPGRGNKKSTWSRHKRESSFCTCPIWMSGGGRREKTEPKAEDSELNPFSCVSRERKIRIVFFTLSCASSNTSWELRYMGPWFLKGRNWGSDRSCDMTTVTASGQGFLCLHRLGPSLTRDSVNCICLVPHPQCGLLLLPPSLSMLPII